MAIFQVVSFSNKNVFRFLRSHLTKLNKHFILLHMILQKKHNKFGNLNNM